MLYNNYVQIKTFIKRDSLTLATNTITTVFKYMPPTTLTSHTTHTHTHTHTHLPGKED